MKLGTLTGLLRNSFLSLVTRLITRFSSAALFILIARWVGAAEAGAYSLAVTFLAVFTALSHWGLDELTVREVAKNREAGSRYLVNFTVLRLLLSGLFYAILIVLVRGLLNYSKQTEGLILWLGLGLVPEGLLTIGQAIFVAHERFESPTVIAGLIAILRVGGGSVLLLSRASLQAIVFLWVLSSVFGAILMMAAAVRLSHPHGILSELDLGFWWEQLRLTPPFFILTLFITLEYQVDVILLSFFRSEKEVGWYAAAQTIFLALFLLPQAYRQAVFPLLSRFYATGSERLGLLFDKSIKFLLIAVLPIAAGLTLLAPYAVRFLYGPGFEPAAWALQVMIWALVFYFLNVPNSRMMIVSNNQRYASVFLGLSMTANVLVNLFLIPRWGVMGAAWAKVVSALAFFVPNCIFVYRKLHRFGGFRALPAPLIAVAGMLPAVWLVRDAALIVPVGVGGAVYIFLLLIFGGVTRHERHLFSQMLRARQQGPQLETETPNTNG